MKIDIAKSYKIIRPLSLVLSGLWIILNPLSIFVENEFAGRFDDFIILPNSVQMLYYLLATSMLYYISLMNATPLLKLAISLGILFVFPPISMIVLLVMDKSILVGINRKITSVNNN